MPEMEKAASAGDLALVGQFDFGDELLARFL
jgi:hypothetical protein